MTNGTHGFIQIIFIFIKTSFMIKIDIIQADITDQDVDAIVNAANEHLAHGGGVAGAISRKGGPEIQKQSNEWIKTQGIVKTGTAAMTSGGLLKAKYVIHAVGPVMGSGDEDNKLRSATLSALELANKYEIKSIAFPAISTGIFGYPIEKCAKIMFKTVLDYSEKKSSLNNVIFSLYDNNSFTIFQNTYTILRRS